MLLTFFRLSVLCVALAGTMFPQFLNVQATKDDWEEINFEFDSSVLTDGFPSLLRLAELLGQNADYKVALVGHADYVGSARYNDRLAVKRAETVKTFLEKYGARPGQITAESRGKNAPKVNQKTDEARFVNRRVEMTVRDGQGRIVGAGGVGDAIKLLEQIAKKQEECCDAILKKLDKLDAILAALTDLKNENARLRSDIDALKAAQGGLEKQVAEVPKTPPVSESQMTKMAEDAAKKAVGDKMPRFSLMGVNIGTDDEGQVFYSGRGRFFAPFWEKLAFQMEAEYMGWTGRKEGQFDAGLVGRHKSFQLGLFSSFKHVVLSEYAEGGTLGQGSFTADYIFSRGKVGLFGAKGFMDRSLLQTRHLSRNLIENVYARSVDQIGVSATVGLWGRNWAEGNIGFLSGYANPSRAGGMVRLVMPFKEHWAFTAEGGINETLLTPVTYGRWAVGVQFGSFLEPKRFAQVNHPVPADIPRVRYEIVKERVRTGNDAPVANAGPDLFGIRAGTVVLDGSASYDPDGDPITFRWSQVAGPSVALSGADTARASFAAADAQVYGFRLEVIDNQGGRGVDSVSVSVREAPRVRIISFSATPPAISVGGTSTLTWSVENADSVTISSVGNVNAQTGTHVVSPSDTTVYVLTAKNAVSEAAASVIVVVDRPTPSFVRCQVTPANIVEGESATIAWETRFSQGVTLSGFGAVPVTGSQVVSPQQTTTYTLAATNPVGTTSCPVTVQVTKGAVPRIINLTAQPLEILAGTSTTVSWQVENADRVTIEGINGNVNPKSGNAQVSPTTTTAYLLTASNRFGAVVASVTVTVLQPAKVTLFTVNPTEVEANKPFVLSWATENASEILISNGLGTRMPAGSVTLQVGVDTTYTIVATNKLSQATATVTIKVKQAPVVPPGQPPIANAGPDFGTLQREFVLDGSGSSDPEGGPLTYRWRSLGTSAVVLDPTSATTRVQIGGPRGAYDFELTVTDSAGNVAVDTVRVQYVGQ